MGTVEWAVFSGWAVVALWLGRDAYRFAASAAGSQRGVDVISRGHGFLLAACRFTAVLGIASLEIAVVLGANLTWLVIGAPVALVVMGLVAFAGTQLLARQHGLGSSDA